MGREAAVGERTFPATTLTLKSDDSGAKERGGGRPPPRNPLRGMQRLAAFGHWRWETAGINPACIRTSSTEGAGEVGLPRGTHLRGMTGLEGQGGWRWEWAWMGRAWT